MIVFGATNLALREAKEAGFDRLIAQQEDYIVPAGTWVGLGCLPSIDYLTDEVLVTTSIKH